MVKVTYLFCTVELLLRMQISVHLLNSCCLADGYAIETISDPNFVLNFVPNLAVDLCAYQSSFS